MIISKPAKVSTFAKYLFSYIAIFSVLIGGFFLILRSQLAEKYHAQRTEQISVQLQSLGDHLNNELVFLTQVDRLITSNQDIMLANYRTESKFHWATYDELSQYVESSNIINTIVYYSKFSGHVFYTDRHVAQENGVFTIWNGDLGTIDFDSSPYMDASTGQLIWLDNGKASFLIYFPVNSSHARYIYFYILDTQNIQSQLSTLVSEELPGVALVDSTGRCVTGIHFDPGSQTVPNESGIYPLEGGRTLCVSNGIRSSFSVAAIISEDFLSQQVNDTFLSAYLSLLGLSVLGIALVYFAMALTYRPLSSLIRDHIPTSHRGQNYLDLLSENFSHLTQQKEKLQQNLDNYRTFVQKDLMGSVLTRQFAIEPASLDRIFEAVSASGELLVIKASGAQSGQLLGPLSEALGRCFCLSETDGTAFYLVASPEPLGSLVRDACTLLHRETGCLFALSEPSGSILDLPLLCENAAAACGAWPQTPVAQYQPSGSSGSPFSYPHDILNSLSNLLRDNRFGQAREAIQSIFAKLDRHNAQSPLPSYFSNCIVLDLLTILSNSMGAARIDFNAYSDSFYEAIRLCRDYNPEEGTQELQSLISELLFFYEKEASNRMSHVAPLQQLMEGNFCQPDFSISAIADTYHVSISRMSVLFKKEMGLGFADCLWQMRLKKAKELLTSTDLSIDEISVTVGYLNPNSFRRKFKQETGLSPSQYRDSLQ